MRDGWRPPLNFIALDRASTSQKSRCTDFSVNIPKLKSFIKQRTTRARLVKAAHRSKMTFPFSLSFVGGLFHLISALLLVTYRLRDKPDSFSARNRSKQTSASKECRCLTSGARKEKGRLENALKDVEKEGDSAGGSPDNRL